MPLPYPDPATFTSQPSFTDNADNLASLLDKHLCGNLDDALWLHQIGMVLQPHDAGIDAKIFPTLFIDDDGDDEEETQPAAIQIAIKLEQVLEGVDLTEDMSEAGEPFRDALRWSYMTQARAQARDDDEFEALELAQKAVELMPSSTCTGNHGSAFMLMAQMLDEVSGNAQALVASIHRLVDGGGNTAHLLALPADFSALAAHILAQRQLQQNDQDIVLPRRQLSDSFFRFRYAEAEERQALIERGLAMPDGDRQWTEMARTYLAMDSGWRIHEGDLYLPDGETIVDLNLIVTGDLICDVYSDEGECTVLVLGDLRCQQVFSVYGLFVWGDAIVGDTVYQYYNDWAFEVVGTLSARGFIIQDKSAGAHKTVLDYHYNSYGFDNQLSDHAMYWAGLNPEKRGGASMNVLRRAYANGRSTYPAPPAHEARVQQHGEARAWQRRIVEGSLTAEETQTKLADPDWAWQIASLLPAPCWTPALLEQAGHHAEPRIRARTAARLTQGADMLFARLASDPVAAVRAEAAFNAHCPTALWPGLAGDENADVRAALAYGRYACKTALPEALQLALASDQESRVRRAMAVQTDLVDTARQRLAQDPDEVVRTRLKEPQ
ncbi:hypothetical protein GCM10007907_22850 [Chitinimonas prasina]|uniref:HEAT repeat domain-containing protein n=1 Tax=Chitinimonas prasina TaxID=1434937 RepID=A0ABQ5YJH5_9NEIS|nr:hypothetical protein [Chitinimonas prasina]GLR13495.1 hypothetical protein GCM10007907_22850 [Chitinimonas prasina]